MLLHKAMETWGLSVAAAGISLISTKQKWGLKYFRKNANLLGKNNLT